MVITKRTRIVGAAALVAGALIGPGLARSEGRGCRTSRGRVIP
jgi:hypothetical protein